MMKYPPILNSLPIKYFTNKTLLFQTKNDTMSTNPIENSQEKKTNTLETELNLINYP